MVPPVYNRARLSELPLPMLVLVPDEPNLESVEEAENTHNEESDPLSTSLNISNDIRGNESTAHLNDGIATNLPLANDFGSSNALPCASNATATNNNDLSTHVNDGDGSADEFGSLDSLEALQYSFSATANNNNAFSSHLDDANASNLPAANELALNAMQNAPNFVDNGENSPPVHSNDGIAANLSVAKGVGSSDALPSIATSNINNDLPSNVVRNDSNNLNSGLLQLNIKEEPQLPTMDEEDIDAMENIFNESHENVDEDASNMGNIFNESHENLDDDVDAMENISNESYEKLNASDDDILVHRGDAMPPPIAEKGLSYQVKANDIVSGNMPYATNVSKKNCLFH